MDQVAGELTLEHAAGSPELNSIHHDRLYERVKQLDLQQWVSEATWPGKGVFRVSHGEFPTILLHSSPPRQRRPRRFY